MKRKLLALAALVLLIGPMGAGAASIVYDVNRTIGAGTVTGFVQTDGTLGVLSGANITDWSLTLTAPNLLSGSPSVISFAGGGQTILQGTATTATLTQLLFDFSSAPVNGLSHFFLLQSANSFWCLETGGCTGAGPGEFMGRGSQSVVAQSVFHNGPVVMASVTAAVAPVPEPEIYAMMGLGLGLLGWIGRKKKLSDAATA